MLMQSNYNNVDCKETRIHNRIHAIGFAEHAIQRDANSHRKASKMTKRTPITTPAIAPGGSGSSVDPGAADGKDDAEANGNTLCIEEKATLMASTDAFVDGNKYGPAYVKNFKNRDFGLAAIRSTSITDALSGPTTAAGSSARKIRADIVRTGIPGLAVAPAARRRRRRPEVPSRVTVKFAESTISRTETRDAGTPRPELTDDWKDCDIGAVQLVAEKLVFSTVVENLTYARAVGVGDADDPREADCEVVPEALGERETAGDTDRVMVVLLVGERDGVRVPDGVGCDVTDCERVLLVELLLERLAVTESDGVAERLSVGVAEGVTDIESVGEGLVDVDGVSLID